MKKHNAVNERIKRKYFTYLKEAKRYSEKTVDTTATALSRFEAYTRYRDFKAFHFEQAIAFKRYLAEQKNSHTGEALSKATLYSTLTQLRRFFQWLAWQPGYRSRLQYVDADYFNISDKEARIATARRSQKVPTIEQIRRVIDIMPRETEIQLRNRALIAFTLLTGARDSAIASMKLKHVDLIRGCFFQDAREVKTKFSKTFDTYFFPVDDDIREIVVSWISFLRKEKLWGNDDPLFPATQMALNGSRQFQAVGLSRSHWSNTTPIRKIFREAFSEAGLPYFNPHSFRNTLVQLGQRICQTPEQFKTWSQNLGHEQVLTTLTSYGEVSSQRQREIMESFAIAQKTGQPQVLDIAKTLVEMLSPQL